MKYLFLKSAKVITLVVILFVASTAVSMAQPPSDGGLTDQGGGVQDNGGQAASVPLDSNMTLLFALTSVVFIATKVKKNKLVLGN